MASHGDNFNVKSLLGLKVKMKVFLKSLERDVSLVIENEFKESDLRMSLRYLKLMLRQLTL